MNTWGWEKCEWNAQLCVLYPRGLQVAISLIAMIAMAHGLGLWGNVRAHTYPRKLKLPSREWASYSLKKTCFFFFFCLILLSFLLHQTFCYYLLSQLPDRHILYSLAPLHSYTCNLLLVYMQNAFLSPLTIFCHLANVDLLFLPPFFFKKFFLSIRVSCSSLL